MSARVGFGMRRGVAPPSPRHARTDPPPVLPGAARGPIGEAGDWFVEQIGHLRHVAWSLCFIGFLIYVFVITTYRVPIAEVGVGLALFGLLIQGGTLRFPRLLVLFTLLLLWSTLGMTTSRWPALVSEEVINLAKLGLILLAAVNAVRSRSQIRFFMIFWLGCYALFPLRGTYFNYFLGGYTMHGRALWNYTYANSNDLAAMSLLMLAIAAGVLVSERKGWIRNAAIAGVVMLTLLIILTQSRAGILGLAVFGMFALLRSRRQLKSLVLGAVTIAIVVAVAPSSVWERMSGLTKATSVEQLDAVDREGSAAQRFEIWRTAARIIPDHLVFGVGWGVYPEASNVYAPHGGAGGGGLGRVDAHSTYLTVLAETGAIGFMLFMALVFGTLWSAEQTRRRCARELPKASYQLLFLELGLIAYMISGIWGSYAKLNFLYLYLVLMYATAHACETDRAALRRLGAPPAPARARLAEA